MGTGRVHASRESIRKKLIVKGVSRKRTKEQNVIKNLQRKGVSGIDRDT